MLARPAPAAAAPNAPIDPAGTAGGASAPLSLPVARNSLPPIDAPKVMASATSLEVDGVAVELDPRASSGARVVFLHDLASVLKNKRELWLQLNPGSAFPGVVALFMDASARGSLFKSVVYTLAFAGYSNIALVVRNADGELGVLPLNGRVPGLAPWKERHLGITLAAELGSDGAVRLWREPAGRRGEPPSSLTLDELPAEIERRWQALGAPPATEPDAPEHRAVFTIANDTAYSAIIRLADALSEARRTYAGEDGAMQWPAFIPTPGAGARDLAEFFPRTNRRSTELEPPPDVHRRPASVDQRVYMASLALTGGVRRANFRALDRALASDGFGSLPETVVPWGFALDGELWRLRLGLEFAFTGESAQDPLNGGHVSFSLLTGSVTLGFEILRFQRSTLFVATGLAGGDLSVNGRTPGLTLFSDQLSPWEKRAVVYNYTHVPLELGFEHVVPFTHQPREGWGLLFGIRGGVGFSLGGRWSATRQEHHLSGPDFDTSGLQARLVLGVAAFGEKH